MEKQPKMLSRQERLEQVDLDRKRSYAAVKANDLIQKQRYMLSKNEGGSLSLAEQKALLYIISRITPEDRELREQIFDVREFYTICGISPDNGNNYRNLKAAITKLASRVMWLVNGDTETTVRWIDKAKIIRNQGRIKIRLDEDLTPYLILLSKNYTKIPLHDVIKMKSKYGIMLYEILRSYVYAGEKIVFELDDLKERLDCSSYTNFANFRNRVLKPALKDINTYSELSAEMTLHKIGRQFTHVEFKIRDLSRSSNPEDQEELIRRGSNVDRELDPNQMTIFDMMYGSDAVISE